MDRCFFQRAEEAVLEALTLDEPTRGRFLAELHSRDPELAVHVEHLVLLDEESRRAFATRGEIPAPIEDLADDPLVGKELAGYYLIRVIGVGGMGRVYEARQRFPDRRVAVKVIGSRLYPSRIARRFRQEAQILGALEHPGICRVIEAGIAALGIDNVPFIAMEYVDGLRLDIAALSMPVTARIACMAKVCEAVGYAHRQGVFHRDLKPGNVLVHLSPAAKGRPPEPQPKILDFGVARAVQDRSEAWTLTVTGQLIGTPRYMSPQQAAGQETDARADVYSLGVMLAELLTPTRGVSIARLGPASREFGRTVPTDLRTIIAKATELDPDRRYATADELGDDLCRHLQGRPILARRPTLAYRSARFIVRNRILTAAIALGIVAVVSTTGALWNRSHAIESRRLAESYSAQRVFGEYMTVIQEIHSALEADDVGVAHARLATAAADLRGWEWEYLRRICDQSIARWNLPADLAGQTPTAVAIDHDALVLVFGERLARFVPGESRPSISTLSPSDDLDWITDPASAESSDRRWTATAGPGGIVLKANAQGKAAPQLDGAPAQAQCVAFLPGEPARLAAAVGPMIRIWDPATSRRVCQFRGHTARITAIAAAPTGPESADCTVWTCSDDGTVRLWNPSIAGGDFRALPKEGLTIWHPFTTVGRHHADRAAFEFIDFTTNTTIATISGHRGMPSRYAVTPDRRFAPLFSPDTGGALHCYQIPSGKLLARREGMQNQDWLFSLDPAREHCLIAGGESGILRAINLPDLTDIAAFNVGRIIESGCVSPDGKLVALVHPGNQMSIHSLADGAKVAEIQTRGTAPIYPNFSDDSSLVIALNIKESNLNAWDAKTGELHRRVRISEGPLCCVKLHGFNRIAVSCSDGSVHLYPTNPELFTGAAATSPWMPTLTIRDIYEPIHMLAVSADSRSLLGWTPNSPSIIWQGGTPTRMGSGEPGPPR